MITAKESWSSSLADLKQGKLPAPSPPQENPSFTIRARLLRTTDSSIVRTLCYSFQAPPARRYRVSNIETQRPKNPHRLEKIANSENFLTPRSDSTKMSSCFSTLHSKHKTINSIVHYSQLIQHLISRRKKYRQSIKYRTESAAKDMSISGSLLLLSRQKTSCSKISKIARLKTKNRLSLFRESTTQIPIKFSRTS